MARNPGPMRGADTVHCRHENLVLFGAPRALTAGDFDGERAFFGDRVHACHPALVFAAGMRALVIGGGNLGSVGRSGRQHEAGEGGDWYWAERGAVEVADQRDWSLGAHRLWRRDAPDRRSPTSASSDVGKIQ